VGGAVRVSGTSGPRGDEVILAEVRPRLADDVFFAPADEGVYVRGGAGAAVLSGKSTCDWLDRLVRYLDGRHTLGELCGRLSDDRRIVVEGIITGLLDAGLVRDVGADGPHTLSASEQDTYRAEIAFIRQFVDSAEQRFQRYRQTPVVAIGSGRMLAAWLRSAQRSGMARIRLALTDECATEEYLSPAYTLLARLPVPQDETALRAAVNAGDVVVHLSDAPMHERAVLLDRLCQQAGKTLLQAVVHGDRIWVGPVQEGTAAGWESISRRIDGLGEVVGGVDQVTASAAEIAGNRVAGMCFRHLTGILRVTEHPQVCEIEDSTLGHTAHTLLPHPLARPAAPDAEQDFLARIAELRAGPRLSEDDLASRSVACYGDRLGVFREIEEHDFTQVPLRVSQVSVSDPMGLRRRAGLPDTVVGSGLHFAEVRRIANRRAFELYASTTVDERRCVDDTAGAVSVWSYDLLGSSARLVDAATAFPCLGGLESARSAVGSGDDWTQAVTTSLLGLCRELTVSDLPAATEPFPAIDLSGMDLGAEGERFLRALDLAEEPIAVYDVTGRLRVPTLGFCLGADTVAYISALEPAEALRDGLREVLLAYQARITGQSDYAPAKVPTLPSGLRGTATAQPCPAVESGDLVGLLTRGGHRPVVVPLDHDPAVSAVFPYVVRVIDA
jgi:hypothetical protein